MERLVQHGGVMSVISPLRQFVTDREHHLVDVTILMPCLNEVVSLPHCIANAQEAIERIGSLYGLTGEIVVADNGSTDGSQSLAEMLGARVVTVTEPGYGAALIGGCKAAAGRYVLMADADGSYDFLDGVEMIRRLHEGADLCMGSRFKGRIEPGAMPWKNRYIGNPVLTGILNLFFRSGVSDAHCGLRAITRDAFFALNLTGTGMEFASEMVIKASLKRMQIAEVPATLSKDLRNRPPHLRPWRDGWRHLRYLLMLSPIWMFGIPATVGILCSLWIFCVAGLHLAGILAGHGPFGDSWLVLAGFMFTTAHFSAIITVATLLYGIREGFRSASPGFVRLMSKLSLEAMIVSGLALILVALVGMGMVGFYWSSSSFVALPTTLPLIIAAALGAVGLQNISGGFLLAIISGNDAGGFPRKPRKSS